MPLPPALAARLKKRGILTVEAQNEPDEEIIAEDYSGEAEEPEKEETQEELQVLINNTNLPPGWWKVKDPKTSYTYYWDSETDKVCWRHPLDKEADITYCASQLANMEKNVTPQPQIEEQPLPPGTENPQENENPYGVMPMVGPMEPPKDPPPRRERERERDRGRDGGRRRDSRKRKHKEDELDPMDPAAYSEAPRGTWSTGLPKSNEAKTGVDVTANGPLFQMRPYPSPGAILRANAKASNKEDDDD